MITAQGFAEVLQATGQIGELVKASAELFGHRGGAAAFAVSAPRPVFASGDMSLEQGGDVERGRLIFNAGGCASCHQSVGQDDRLKLGGGLELKSPFGSFFVPNISPDPKDGIGSWKVADLVNAMQAGVSPDGRHYYPAFPYATYAHAKVEDIRDLLVYLRSLPPVAGRAPEHRLAFPFSIRRTLGFWKLIYFERTPVVPVPAQSPDWNRGHYLVEALGHCAECHSGRDLLGGIVPDQRFAGGPDLEGKGWVPNITPDKDGLADWSLNDIAYALKTGETPDGDSVGGSMRAVVRNMAELPPADLAAISTYVKSLPARPSPPHPRQQD
jgi:mono/diheme cytochrome c family protein